MQAQLACRAGASFQGHAQPQRPAARRSAVVTRATSDPVLKKPEPPARPAPPKPAAEPEAAPAAAAPSTTGTPAVAAAAAVAPVGVTLEYQRQQAKAMQKYFRSRKQEKTVDEGRKLGWTRKNEITNGRWVMFGILVGMLTEYATGVSFPEQIKITGEFLGLIDID